MAFLCPGTFPLSSCCCLLVTWGLSRLHVKFHFLFLCYCCSVFNTTTLFSHDVSWRLEGVEMWPGNAECVTGYALCGYCWFRKINKYWQYWFGCGNQAWLILGQAGTHTQAHPQQRKKTLYFTSYSFIEPVQSQPWFKHLAGRLAISRPAALSGNAWRGSKEHSSVNSQSH